MAGTATVIFGAVFLVFISQFSAAIPACKKEDYKQMVLPCDSKTRTRSVVYYLNTSCNSTGGSPAPPPIHGIPCDCPPGKGLLADKGDLTSNKCQPCTAGQYGPGGEIISNWHLWTNNGTTPPEGSGIITFCQMSRDYIKSCGAWKASADNITIDSGENAMSQCLSSVLIITRKFVMPNNGSWVSFDYRVDGRSCRRTRYVGCNGLGFFIDNQQVIKYSGRQFLWSTASFNLTTGTHTLKWIFRKNCFSFSPAYTDKVFIRSIALVGTEEPNVTCTQCPPGFYSNKIGASKCTPCSYFQYQSKKGQSKCDACPSNTYSMFGATACLPLPNCTTHDVIVAPGNISTCSIAPNGTCVTTVYPQYINVKGLGNKPLCNSQYSKPLSPKQVLCRCQPGLEISKDGGKVKCRACSKGMFSDGLACSRCQKGHVALPGKHYYVWQNSTLPEGFITNCVGDCSIKLGWIPAGNLIRTGHVIGNVDSYIQSPKFEVESQLARITFNCSITCNVTTSVSMKKQPAGRGEHLANIQDCNLVFQVWSNDTLIDQANCTSPKGKYVYFHESRRDGEVVPHVYPLKKGNYTFRWVFHQVDEARALSAAFEGKIFSISVLGVTSGEARNCTKCPAGYHSVSDNTDCAICPNGTASLAGADSCTPCSEGYFAPKEGSKTCLRCGKNTSTTKNKDGCGTNNCTFSPAPGVVYDLNRLSRPGGPMIEILTYQPSRLRPRSGRRPPYLSIWPVHSSYHVNLCTVQHDNSSCTYSDPKSRLKKPLPVMACRRAWWSRDISVGTVIGYSAKDDVRSGLIVDLLHGDRCYGGPGKSNSNYSTTLDLVCDVNAGVGNPGPENNYTNILRGRCHYKFVWRSLYACPKCQPGDVTRLVGACVNGTRNITYLRSLPCWDSGADTDVPTPQPEKCVTPTETVAYSVQKSNKVNSILISVGILVIVALLAVAGFFVYKHRVMKYRYYTLMARNLPMSRLEQEDDENLFLGDQDADPVAGSTATVSTSTVRA